MSLLLEFLKLIAAGIAGAVAAGFFTAFFNFRRFRKEETWKQRRDTYHSIIVGIGKIRESASAIEDYYSSKGFMGQENWGPFGDTFNSLREISRTDDYVISPTAAKALKTFLRTFDDPAFGGMPPDDDAAAVLKAVHAVIPIIRSEAAKHLGIDLSKDF